MCNVPQETPHQGCSSQVGEADEADEASFSTPTLEGLLAHGAKTLGLGKLA